MHRSAHVDTFSRDNLPPPSQRPDFLDSPDTRYPARMDAAVELLDAMIERGISCELIVGETEQIVRQAVIAKFRRRELIAIASCDVLTTGFDAPVVDVLAAKLMRAARETGARSVVLGGGVAANSLLRSEVARLAEAEGLRVALPSRAMCTDNAAMIGALAQQKLNKGLTFDPYLVKADSSLETI